MKKGLFYLLAVMLTFVSCNKTDFDFSPKEAVVNNYNTAFIKTFGEPSPSQTWGFKSTNATRAAQTNSNQWGTDEWDGRYKNTLKKSDIKDITEQELADVLAVFNQKGAESYTALVDWDCFFVQQVYKGTASYKDGYGQDVVGGEHMDWLCAYDPVGFEDVVYGLPEYNYQPHYFTNHDDHVNNFNAANGFVMLMMYSSTQRFGYKSSTDNGHVFYHFRMEKINGNYYVGFDFYANGQNPNEQVHRDLIYNDWIVKIIPGTGVNPPADKLRIMAEDLSAKEGTDFDFNDVVIDVEIVDGRANCVLQAAGGTLPLRIGGIDALEVHSMFNVDVTTMVNTGIGERLEPVNFAIEGINNAADITLEVYKNGEWMEMEARQGVPAAKIAVNQDVQWCSERESILKRYPDFKNWVQNVDYIWW